MQRSTILGTILMFLGIVPFVVWVLDYANVIRPGEQPGEFGIILMSFALIGLGLLLVKGKGDTITGALMSYVKRRVDSSDEE